MLDVTQAGQSYSGDTLHVFDSANDVGTLDSSGGQEYQIASL